ncbi:MAG: hypothetical protein Q9195_008323 [Heterodermia aff. obscurata]
MQGPLISLLLLALIHRFAVVSALSQQLCTTKQGTKSVKPVPSTTYALTITLTKTVLITSTPSTTTTPKAVTSTVSTTNVVTQTTTAPANTNTVTITTTNITGTETITGTTTQTTTATATTTTTVSSTSTVPPPAGFTPITQEIGYVPKIKEREVLGLAARAASSSQIVAKLKNGKCTVSPTLYPTSVICGQLSETITTKTTTKTASTTRTITAGTPTSTVTSTFTSTSTSTFVPPAVTSTVTASATVTTTTSTDTTVLVTQTTTSTVTVSNPAATSYAACSSANLITNANGGHTIDEVDGGVGNSASFVSVGSSYDCCVACITSTDNCRGFVYIGISGFECELITGTTCDPGVSFGGTQFKTNPTSTDPGLPIGNGACGNIANGGVNTNY